MGGTYQLSDFKDRKSQYPTRRKLIHNAADAENVYTVQRDEGAVYEEGIAFSANFMNKFDKKIGDMFPVKVENGGTGATNGRDALRNLGLNITIGNFTPRIISGNPNSSAIEYRMDNPSNPVDVGGVAGYYYRIGELCFVSIGIKIWITSTGQRGGENAYIIISDLPYSSQGIPAQSLASSECSSLGGILVNEGGEYRINPNENKINVLQNSGQLSSYFKSANNWAWFKCSGIYLCK